MEIKRPRSRDRGEAKEGKGVFKRGSGLGQGPVGREDAVKAPVNKPKEPEVQNNSQRPMDRSIYGDMNSQQHQSTPMAGFGGGNNGGYNTSGTPTGSSRGRSRLGCLIMIVALVLVFFLMKSMSGISNNSSSTNSGTTTSTTQSTSNTSPTSGSGTVSTSSPSGSNATLFGGTSPTGASIASGNGYSSGWQLTSNNGHLNTNVSSNIREKYTTIKGNNEDEITIMVFLCGTDLESNYAMATRDLQEMLAATLSDKIRIVIFSGGCTRWQNDVMSNGVNQIYDITSAGLRRINDNAGSTPMTDPNTLSAFVKWTAENYPANRMGLIMWDHGGGSVTGYGYDQRYGRTGSMSLTEIYEALNAADVKFDFIGFDACLMATAETALMASNFADYMIASEEVEPGIGWYYTNWLNKLAANTSMPTVELGKNIIDDYTARCQQECPGQDTTLSLIDLAELQGTLPAKMGEFAEETTSLIENGNYQTVARARSSSQEFSRQSKIDQIDFVHFANLLGTNSGKELIQTIMNAVKYNRASRGMHNAYGLSIYFPYRNVGSVDLMTSCYNTIGIDNKFAKCIRQFAQVQVGGQASSGGSSSPLWTLLNSGDNGYWSSSSNYGNGYGSGYGSGSYGGTMDEGDIVNLLNQLFGGSVSNYDSYGFGRLNAENTRFLGEDQLDANTLAKYISENAMDAEDFVWKENADGYASIQLTDEQWSRITTVEMSLFFDDGEGYIDLGMDNIYDFDSAGNLLPVVDDSWVSIDGQPIAYYHLYTCDDANTGEYTIVGRSPILLNDQRADLIIVFNDKNPSGFIAGVRYTYPDGETEAVAKAQESLSKGDKIDFLCDYYGYDGSFQDSYYLGDQYIVEDPETIEISNTIVGDSILVSYRFEDIFGETYWTPTL